MFKKIILSLICTIFSLNSYGMPVSIANLKTEIEKVIREKIKDFSIEKLTPTDLVIASSRAPGLAFRKALRLNTTNDETQKKHYKAQYQLILISFACEYWFKNPGIEDDEFNIAHAIASAFSSFYRLGFDEDLTPEEYSYYEEIAGKFFKKYYELYLEKLKSESEL